GRSAGAKALVPLLQDLAKQIPMPVLAATDYRPHPEETPDPAKDGRWLRDEWWLAAPIVDQPLPKALDMLCADFEYEWRFHRGVLQLRHKRWYLPEGEQGEKSIVTLFPKLSPLVNPKRDD